MQDSQRRQNREFETIPDFVERLDDFGDAVALVEFGDDGPRELSYRELAARGRSVAAALAGRGVDEGTAAAIVAPNGIDRVIASFALALLGATCVRIEAEADSDRLRTLLHDSGATWLFVAPQVLPAVRHAIGGDGLDVRLVILGHGGGGDAAGCGGTIRLDDLSSDGEVPAGRVRPDTIASRFYTSGTTGTPKAVPITHGNAVACMMPFVRRRFIGPGDRVLLPLPLHHSYAYVIGLLVSLASGATVVFPGGVGGPALQQALRDGRVTVVLGVPRLYEALLAAIENRIRGEGVVVRTLLRTLEAISRTVLRATGRRIGRTLLAPLHKRIAPALRLMVSGGARLDPRTERRLEVLGWEVLQGYGLVETTTAATFNEPRARKPGSAGRPGESAEVRIVPVEDREHGEIQFRGPIVFGGYANNPEANARAFTEDGWLRTGDLGWFDEDGFLFIAGRLDEMIVLPDGKNVSPEDVEAAYSRIELVKDVGVMQRDGRLVALVEPDMEAAKGTAGQRLKEWLSVAFDEVGQTLPRYMRVADVVLTRETLPKNPLGKLRRHLLPEILERAERGEAPPPPEISPEDEERMAAPRATRLLEVLGERVPDVRIHPDMSLQLDLGIDSLGWVDLGLEIERRVGVTLPEERTAEAVTVRDLIDVVEQAEASEGEAEARRAERRRALEEERERWLAEPGAAANAVGRVLHWLARGASFALFRPRVEGRRLVPAEGPLVIAANHLSDADPVVLAAVLPYATLRNAWWGAESDRVFGNAIGRALARPVHLFPVDERAPGASLDTAAEVLKRGRILVWFPEEWRSPNGELQDFRRGIGALVERTGAAVVPCGIHGTFEAMPRTARFPRPHRVRIRFGRPVPARYLIPDPAPEDEDERLRAIARRVREEVERVLEEGKGSSEAG